ncbi:hypothetical protein G647_09252 [Cladophialophora carrionii CBS 160.54]|uniref:Uncharacterized protein n=1 Tax=Cladophialophora carrionii CBS 160.54 TaxID=1279043 RepID=V9CZI0_9EURO|nr:uncharacterized protein G647_09252 [Cladophialophora carrionii CBS 160.54]ETI19418.1 hypothetical protein G647_09252 [Cladophialophora carrionii CBS 160.54]
MVTLRSQRTFLGLHSGSPMLRPGHRPLPGHRASSPAFSDAYPYRGGPRHGYPRVGSVDTVASSPALTYHRRPGLPGYRPELNNSFSSSIRLPSPAVSFVNGLPGNGYPTQRTTTPMSTSLQSLRPAWNHSAASFRGLTKSPTESTAPPYYDYSESFLEEDCFSSPDDPSAANLPFNMDQTIMEDDDIPERRQAQSPFGTMPGSAFRPLELPTSHNRRPSENSKHSKYSYTGVIPPRQSSLGATTGHKRGTSRTPASQEVITRSATTDQVARSKYENPQASTASRRASHSTHSSAFFPNACRSPRDLTTLAARVHSPVFDEKPSISGLLEYGNPKRDSGRRKAFSDGQQIRAQWQLPSFSFRPLSFGTYSPGLKERPKTSGDVRSKDGPDILSPMPERPMSSQSRKRFSRILEISDSYVTDQGKPPYTPQTSSRLDAVEEHPDLQSLERSLSSPSEFESRLNAVNQERREQEHAAEHASPSANADTSQITMQERSTIESLLDRHIECLGLNESGDDVEEGPFEGADALAHSDPAPKSSGESTIKPSPVVQQALPQWNFRPTTSSSTIQHSSLASSERRRLIPRRLFASMDARLPPGAVLADIQGPCTSNPTSTISDLQPRLSGWQTLPSTSGLVTSDSARSTAKASLASGDIADIDSDPPNARFKIRRVSELSLSPETVSSPRNGRASQPHRRSKSDMLARQMSHRRRRARILIKAKRKSQSLGQLANLAQEDQVDGLMEDVGHSEDWVTEDSPEKNSQTSPVAGYAELSADSVAVQPPTILSAEASVLVPISAPRRWTSMLAAMPNPVKKSIEIVRKASVRTIQSQRSNTSVIEPVNSTRFSAQISRLGSVPQLAPPEFGPPLTSSDLNLSLRFPGPPQVYRPPLRQVQSFFSDDSSAALAHKRPSTLKKRFDLPSFRSGFTKSTGLIGTRHSSTPRGTNTLQTSASYRVRDRESVEYRHEAFGDTVPMSDFAYKKRKVLGRLKEWWKRQCMQKTLDLVRKKSGRNMQHAAWA